jgi:hypothetical protein
MNTSGNKSKSTFRSSFKSTSSRSRIILPLVSIVTAFALSAQAQEAPKGPPPKGSPAKPAVQGAHPPGTGQPGPRQAGPGQAIPGQATPRQAGPAGPGRPAAVPGRGPEGGRFARGAPARNFGGHAYHGRMAWEGGRWRHEMHNGRYGWWWDVGGAWYFYPQQMDGPPAYVSDLEVVDDGGGPDGPDGPDDGTVVGGYPPPGAYPPPPGAYAPPPPPPPGPPDAASGAVGGAIVGGLLGGLISGRPGGAIAGAVTGGTIGAISGAQATARAGYYLAQGNCYYRYPSGQYVQVDPRGCY